MVIEMIISQNSSFVANFPNSKGTGPSPKVPKKIPLRSFYWYQDIYFCDHGHI